MGEISNVVDIYDDASKTWSTAALSQARIDLTATTVGTKAIFAGGFSLAKGTNGSNFSDVVDIYDNATNQWTTSKLSQARTALASTSLGNYAFFAGGYPALYTVSDVIDIYETAPAPFAITGVTSLTCTPVTSTQYSVRFSPDYNGLTGQPVSFSVANEMLPTTQPGPYTLQLYADNPVITLQANQGGTVTPASFTYQWLAPCPRQPSAGLSLVGVNTLSCQPISSTERRVTFTPQYAGQNTSPISFSVVNELVATTSPGPYSLNLYTDNPTITLSAQQGATVSTYRYNWLAVCNSAARAGNGEAGALLTVRVLGNPVAGNTAEVEISGVTGQPVQINLVDMQGKPVHAQRIDQAGALERLSLPIGVSHGVLLLHVSTPTQRQQLKLLRTN